MAIQVYINSIHIVLCTSNGLTMSILLVFMLKELSPNASRDICRNQLEFSNYHLVYYMLIIWRKYILSLIRNLCYTLLLAVIAKVEIPPCTKMMHASLHLQIA